MGTRRCRGPFEDHGVAALYSPADLPVGTRRRCRPSEDDSGLAKRLEQMAKERERRERAAAAADEEFSAEFLTAARKVFQMIDDDDSGTLEKAEIVRAVRANKVAKAASYNLQSVICGTAVFVCLVCGGAGTTERPLHASLRAGGHHVPQ